jgi:hypothetical protein
MIRKAIIAVAVIQAAVVLGCASAFAWESANRWGGSTTHSWGSTSHDNRWGGSSSYEAGVGAEHTNVYGGNTAHAYGGGTEHTNAYGGTTYGAYGAGVAHTTPYGATAYRPPGYTGYPGYAGYPAYHPPVAVPTYSAGCYGCAAAAGAVTGVMAGAAMGAAVASAGAATSYSSGFAAGAAAAAPAPYAMGAAYATLPAGSAAVNRNGTTYYISGSTWFMPSFGANGVYYRVVPAP